MEKTRVLAIVAGADAQRWYRFQLPASKMDDVDITFYPFDLGRDPEEFAHMTAGWFDAQEPYDVVWSASAAYDAQVVADWFVERGATLIGEVDDLFTDVPLGNLAHTHWKGTKKKRVEDFFRNVCGEVACSTPRLVEEFGGRLAPNFIDPEHWVEPPRDGKRDDEVVICCPYGNGRAGDYALAQGALETAISLPQVKVVFMGSIPAWALKYPPGKIVYCQWVPIETYPQMLSWMSPDIIISPMEKNEFNKAKSNLKYLESGATEACFVGQDFGEYARTIASGETGVLCANDKEWTEKLTWMCGDHAERKRIAANGRQDVLANWTWSAVEEHWRQALLGEVSDGNSRDRRMVAS